MSISIFWLVLGCGIPWGAGADSPHLSRMGNRVRILRVHLQRWVWYPTGKEAVGVYPMVTTTMENLATPRLTQTIQKLIGLYRELVATIPVGILLLRVLYVG